MAHYGLVKFTVCNIKIDYASGYLHTLADILIGMRASHCNFM